MGDDIGGVTGGQPDEYHAAAVAFHQCRHRAHVFAEDEVAVPVAGNGTVVGLGGVLADVDRAAELTLAVDDRVAQRATGGVAPPQLAGEFSAQGAAGLDEQRRVDRLVGHPHLRLVGERANQPTRDLLR